MIEEALVEKEVYDAMMSMRRDIGPMVGTPVLDQDGSGSSSSGHSAEWEWVYGDGDMEPPKVIDDVVSTDVMALGDVSRDPARPVAPYIPATKPQSPTNPFPMLDGPMG